MFLNNFINCFDDFEYDTLWEINRHPSNVEEFIIVWKHDHRKFLTRRYKWECTWEQFDITENQFHSQV